MWTFFKTLIFHDLSWFSGPLPFHCGILEIHFTYFNSLSDGKEQLNDGDVSITFTNDHTYKVCLTYVVDMFNINVAEKTCCVNMLLFSYRVLYKMAYYKAMEDLHGLME